MRANTGHDFWRPILDGDLAERARTTVHQIVDGLPSPSSPEVSDVSLSGGSAGLSILCAYLSRAGLDGDENAAQFLSHAVNYVSSEPMGPSLYGGFTGIAWAVAHLNEQLLDPDEDPNEAIDEAIQAYLDQSPWEGDYDLIMGLVGIGVYAFERLPRASAVNCLERVVDRLDETAERSANGVSWLTRPELLPEWQRALCPSGYYNLGLAHGVPGVIAFLGEVCAAGVALQKARPLLDAAVATLLRQRLTSGTHSSFSSWVGPGIEQDDCRLAWCYGDAGVAAALLVAARCVDESEWEREAVAIARRAGKRKPESAGVKDAGLCHGAAGLAHIFNRFFQATGDESFLQAARYWFESTLELRRAGGGIAGFSAYRGPYYGKKEYWQDEIGILEGVAGIALALLAATTAIEPEWDRMLLVSVPAGTTSN
jgi:lantibiotic biosynthesis protein